MRVRCQRSPEPSTSTIATGPRRNLDEAVHSLQNRGAPLAPSTRAFFEPRFGTDFSNVRLHESRAAASLAGSLSARAFTTGNHIVMGGHSASEDEGKHLLAHELTHVVQQRHDGPGKIQRRVCVDPEDMRPEIDPETEKPKNLLDCHTPPRFKWEEAREHIELISQNQFTVLGDGNMVPRYSYPGPPPERPMGVACLHYMHDLEAEEESDKWKIKFDDNVWPHTEMSDRRVFIMSSCSPQHLSSYDDEGNRADTPDWRVLAHELCGHGWLAERGHAPPFIRIYKEGTTNPIARPEHDPTVDIENTIASEVDPSQKPRGTFKDRAPHLGESFGRVTFDEYKIDSARLYDERNPPDANAKRLSDIKYLRQYLVDNEARTDIIGNADRLGPSWYNDQLGCRRAMRVKRHLLTNNPDLAARADEMRIFTRGERDCPIDPHGERTCQPNPPQTVPPSEPNPPQLPSGCELAPPQCQQPPRPIPEPPAQPDGRCRKVDVLIYATVEGPKADFQYEGFDRTVVTFQYEPGSRLTDAVFTRVKADMDRLPESGAGHITTVRVGTMADSFSQVKITLDLTNVNCTTVTEEMPDRLSPLPDATRGDQLENMRKILCDLWDEAHGRLGQNHCESGC